MEQFTLEQASLMKVSLVLPWRLDNIGIVKVLSGLRTNCRDVKERPVAGSVIGDSRRLVPRGCGLLTVRGKKNSLHIQMKAVTSESHNCQLKQTN